MNSNLASAVLRASACHTTPAHTQKKFNNTNKRVHHQTSKEIISQNTTNEGASVCITQEEPNLAQFRSSNCFRVPKLHQINPFNALSIVVLPYDDDGPIYLQQ